MSEASARRGDDESELTFVVDLPEGWCPPPAAARAILAVMLAVQERRESSEANDRRVRMGGWCTELGSSY